MYECLIKWYDGVIGDEELASALITKTLGSGYHPVTADVKFKLASLSVSVNLWEKFINAD